MGVKQQEEEQGQQQKQRDRERDSTPPLLPKDATSPPATPDFGLPAERIPQSDTDPASHRGRKVEDKLKLEDSDEDEDGGVALFGPGLGGLSLWGVDVVEGEGGRDGGDDGLD